LSGLPESLLLAIEDVDDYITRGTNKEQCAVAVLSDVRDEIVEGR
jgi:hypothetical protein